MKSLESLEKFKLSPRFFEESEIKLQYYEAYMQKKDSEFEEHNAKLNAKIAKMESDNRELNNAYRILKLAKDATKNTKNN